MLILLTMKTVRDFILKRIIICELKIILKKKATIVDVYYLWTTNYQLSNFF